MANAVRPERQLTLRIGVDASCWANARGYGRFTRELVGAMVRQSPDDEFVCFLDERAAAVFDLDAPNVRRVIVRLTVSPTAAAADGSSRSPGDMLRMTRAVWRERPDVFYSPTAYTYFPLPPGQRAVATVHDAIVERFPELTIPDRKARIFWKAKVRLALWQAKLVLTDSRYAAGEITEMLGVDPRRLRVADLAPAQAYRLAPDAAAAAATAARFGIPPGREWLMYVGGFNPHKHVDLLARAHGMVAAGDANAPYLLLVGALSDVFHGSQAAIREAITAAGTGDLVKWPGFVNDDDLRHLHAGALALVLPSASEGFGLPAVEAAACGTPVIATTASPLPELLRGGGLFVEPGDVSAIAGAIRTLRVDPAARRAMGVIARERALALTWDASAQAALAAIHEAAA